MARIFDLMQFGVASAVAQSTVGDIADTLTATGSTQGTALLLQKPQNIVTTTAASTGVQLPVASQTNKGDEIVVTNLGASALSVYPQTGGTIQGGAANAAFSVATLKSATFKARDTLNWIVNLSA